MLTLGYLIAVLTLVLVALLIGGVSGWLLGAGWERRRHPAPPCRCSKSNLMVERVDRCTECGLIRLG